MTRYPLPQGIYAVTDNTLTPNERLPQAVAAVIRGGVRTVQYRNKTGDASTRLREAAMLRSVCTQAGALFIVNDDEALAALLTTLWAPLRAEGTETVRARSPVGGRRLLETMGCRVTRRDRGSGRRADRYHRAR